MKTKPIFQCRDLKIEARPWAQEPIEIVKGISFNVFPGQVVALIGESGSGKTTISLAALGYTKPGLHFSGGEAILLEKDMINLDYEEKRLMRGEHVAYLAQSAAATFNPSLTIGEQVIESALLHGALSKETAEKRAIELYIALELPQPYMIGKLYPHQVSGGQLQRLMAAMALVEKPSLLVLDEPTTALDVTTQIEVLKAIKKVIREEKSAAIYVTHDLSVVAQIADHVVVLYDGVIKEQGTVEEIINNPKHSYTNKLMAAVRPTPKANLIEQSVLESEHSNSALAVKNISAGYGGTNKRTPTKLVLRDVSFSLNHGEVVGIIGESGCGKSTLARVISGLLPASSGQILLNEKELHPSVKNRSLNELQLVQFIFQMADTALNPRQTIGEIIGRPLTFYYGVKGKKRDEQVREIMRLVELPDAFMNRRPTEISGGQKQRVNLARGLAAKPTLLLCDEVTSALDTIVGANVISLLKKLGKETGISFVFISHDLSTVSSFADKIVVLYAGRLVEQGTVQEILSPPFHPYTKLLINSVPELRVAWLEETLKKQSTEVGISGTVEMTDIGCPFYNRCHIKIEGLCNTTSAPLTSSLSGHEIACHHLDKALLE